jgi:hypothetical protein
MRKNLDTSRAGMIVFLGVLLGALWLLIAFGTYHEAQRQKYIVSVHPGSVNYGTHSTAVVPMVSVPTHRSSVPMISGNTVRSYAYSGHAKMPGTSSGNNGFKLHTISSATLHSIGGGGSDGGGGTSGGSTGSSKGISYSGSFAVPTLALASPMSSTVSDQFVMANRRKAKPTYGGMAGDEVVDDEDSSITWYWDEEEEDWVSYTPTGTVKEGTDGYYYEWNGTTWVRKGQIEDLGTPIGDAPWLVMLLLMVAYAFFRKTGMTPSEWSNNN